MIFGKHKKELEDTKVELLKFKSDIRDLLWCLGNQTEKIRGRLGGIIEYLYPEHSLQMKLEIRETIMKKLEER